MTSTIDNYEILEKIGSGLRGDVFKARDQSTQNLVAIKILNKVSATTTEHYKRSLREAIIFEHINLVTIYSLGEFQDRVYYIMEYVEGITLKAMLSQGALSEAVVVEIMIQVANALEYLAHFGALYKIDPHNIILTPDGRVKLIEIALPGPEVDGMATGAVIGTIDYLSPEDLMGEKIEPTSRLFNLGSTCYHLLTGSQPFAAESITDKLMDILKKEPPAIQEYNPKVSEKMSSVISKLMAKERKKRPQLSELLEDLMELRRSTLPEISGAFSIISQPFGPQLIRDVVFRHKAYFSQEILYSRDTFSEIPHQAKPGIPKEPTHTSAASRVPTTSPKMEPSPTPPPPVPCPTPRPPKLMPEAMARRYGEMGKESPLAPTKAAPTEKQRFGAMPSLEMEDLLRTDREEAEVSKKEAAKPKIEEEISREEKKITVEETRPIIEKEERHEVASRKIPNFEKALNEDAGMPGPIERLVAHSLWAMKTIQATIGLKFILIANAFDAIIEIFFSYVQGVFRTWKMMKSIQKRIQQHRHHSQIQSLANDLLLCRIQLSRLFSFAGFSLDYWKDKLLDNQRDVLNSTFPLKLVLEIRGRLDDMKQDLSLVTRGQILQTAKKSITDFLLSFIPNPLEVFVVWKDIFILAFLMKYSRQEIQEMYLDMVFFYQRMIEQLENQEGNFYNYDIQENSSILVSYWKFELLDYEEKLGEKPLFEDDVNLTVEKSRKSLQRLLQMLSNPGQFLNPRKWNPYDLLREVKKRQEMGESESLYSLELERWLTRQISDSLEKNGMKMSKEERYLRWQEAKEWRRRYSLYRKANSV